jgi:hypothetical protein
MGWIESQLQLVTSRVEYLFRLISDLTNQLRAAQQGLQGAFQQWGSGSESDRSGVYYADGLSIAAFSSTTGVTVTRSWDSAHDTTSGKVWNVMPDATNALKRQILGKNPDNTYTVITESCSNHP